MDLLVQTLNLILLIYAKLHYLCTIVAQSFHVRICRGGEKNMNIKPALRVTAMEMMAMAPKFLHISSTASATNLLPLLPYTSLLMPTLRHLSR